jgi:hypothetical protein
MPYQYSTASSNGYTAFATSPTVSMFAGFHHQSAPRDSHDTFTTLLAQSKQSKALKAAAGEGKSSGKSSK